MERVTETKLSLEALRQMKSHGRTASPTLIGAIEQIVNRAIETHLDEPFYSEAAPFLDYLGNRMALDCEQALVFALFMEQSTDNRIQISDFARMVGCRTVRVISMMAAADELVKRRLIRRVRKEDCLFYSVPMAVVTAVKEDRLYEPEPIDHLTSEQLFDRMGQIFDEAEEDNSHLLEDLDELVEANLQLPFCQQTRAYDLNKVERLLFYVFCHRFVNLDDEKMRHALTFLKEVGKEYQVMTNSPKYSSQLAINDYWKEIGGLQMLPGTNRSSDRFVRASFYIHAIPQTPDARIAVPSVLSVMRNVSVPFGITTPGKPHISSTRWRSVCDQKNKVYYFDNVLTPNLFWLDLKEIDFSPKAKIKKLSLTHGEIYAGNAVKDLKDSKSFVFLFQTPTL